MSGILAFNCRTRSLPSALRRLSRLGGENERLWSNDNTVVAVTRKAWETGDEFSGDVLVLDSAELVVAADASLYDRPGLSRALSAAWVAPRGSTPSHLIEAAYIAWGPALVDHLVGDYAFAIWDRRRRRLIAARDPYGLRALFYCASGGGIAVSSSSRALAELCGLTGTLNLDRLALQATGLVWSLGTDSCFRGIHTILPGHRLIWDNDKVVHERFWHPPSAPTADPYPPLDAATELRSLLRTSVGERLGSAQATVLMSGGWDSTAVFGAGQIALEKDERSRLRPVSISFPPDDPGCEDELIRKVAGRWNAQVHWLDSSTIPLLDGLEDNAAASDEPSPTLYDSLHLALGRASRATGARIAFDGSGGDQLFAVSDIVLADLLRSGRWLEFARFARSRGLRGRRLLEASLRPQLPDALIRASERVLGRRVRRHYLERPVMRWVQPTFLGEEGLLEREVSILRSMRGNSYAQTESMLQVTAPYWGMGASHVRTTMLQEGVELRSPLMDPRVVEFALNRPVAERASHTGTKLLLRKAMEGLIPSEVLAPRQTRTGTTGEFSRRQMRAAYPGLLTAMFAKPLRLAELGIVDPTAMKACADRFCNGGDDEFLGAGLYCAMTVEHWLRGFDRPFVTTSGGGDAQRDGERFPRHDAAGWAGPDATQHLQRRPLYV